MSVRRESDHLLELAERQFDRVNELKRRVFLDRTAVVLMLLPVVVGVWGAARTQTVSLFLMFSGGWAVGALAAFVFALRLRDSLQSLRVEESVLHEALSLVQSSEHHLAEKEQWTLLERAEFRLRLRRLPVGVAPPPAASAISSPTPTPTTTRPPSTA